MQNINQEETCQKLNSKQNNFYEKLIKSEQKIYKSFKSKICDHI